MYFAVNPTSPDLPAQIAQEIVALQERHEGDPFHVIALVDGAFDEQFFKSSPRNRWPRQSLYANTTLQGLAAAAPQLATFQGQPGALVKWLENLISHCSGKPMLSIIASALDAESLQCHLLPYLVCRTQDSVEWPVRWGDTRVLPGLIATLTDSQRKHLLSPMHCWWTVDRQGKALKWQGAGDAKPAAAEFDKLPMDDAKFATLIDLSEPDAILNTIYESQPDLLRDKKPVQAYEVVSRHLKIATAHRIESAPARYHLSVLAVMLSGDFTKHLAMAAALNRIRTGSEYFSEIANLTPSFWESANTGSSQS